MRSISYDQLLDIYNASEELCKAWPHVTMLELVRLIWNLKKALGHEVKRSGNGHKPEIIKVTELPEEATEGLTCSLTGG